MLTALLGIAFMLPISNTTRSGADDGVRLRGTATHYGTTATFEARVTGDGRYWWRIDGPLPEEARFDGRELVVRDFNGTVTRLTGRDAVVPQVFGALLGGAPRAESAAWPTGPRPFPETTTVADFGADQDSVWATIATLQGQERLVGRRHRTRDGVSSYHSLTRYVGPHRHTAVEIGAVEATSDPLPELRPSGFPMRVTFPDHRMRRIETRRAATGQTMIRGMMGGDARWWILDTGASETVIETGLAAKLAVAPVGQGLVTSMFGQEAGSIYRLPTLTFGEVVVEGLAVTATDLAPLSAAVGESLAGIIGFDLLSRSIIAFEVGQDGVSIGSPESPGELSWQPLRLLDRHPVVDGSIESLTGRLRLDTGAGPGLIVNRWVTETAGLLNGRTTSPINGAPFEARVGPIERLSIGSQGIGPVTALFVTGGDGPIAAVVNDRDLLGNVGAEVLGKYRAVFDYSRARLALVPRS